MVAIGPQFLKNRSDFIHEPVVIIQNVSMRVSSESVLCVFGLQRLDVRDPGRGKSDGR